MHTIFEEIKTLWGEIILPNVSDIGTVHLCPNLSIMTRKQLYFN